MSRRDGGRETWHRLLEWDRGQADSERLAANILISEGFENVDPSHPLGGRDGGKDIICNFNNDKWIGGVYFPRGQQTFSEIKKKFLHDAEGIKKNGAKGFIFITNQEITLLHRKELEDKCDVDVRIYHLERIADILNTPKMYGVRLDFLDIEMTKEEQVSVFASRDDEKKLINMQKDIEFIKQRLYGAELPYEDIFSVEDEEIRSLDEVVKMMNEFCDKVWFNRHLSLAYRVESGMESVDPKIWKGAIESAQKMINKYGEQNLGPYSDFEWGMLNGKLSALRWVLGDEWDMLDT